MSDEPRGEHVPTVAAYGEPDDHLRMTVLIAEALAPHQPEAAAVCQRAQTNPWPARFEALSELLQTVALRRPGVVCRVRDLGALPELPPNRGPDRWDDRSFAREHAQLRARLERAADSGVLSVDRAPPPARGFRTFRPLRLPSASVLSVDRAPPPAGALIDRIEPSLRPLARWLQAQGRVDGAALEACAEEGDPAYLLATMWDVIGRDARVAALRLSALRPPQRLNGVFGPIALRPQEGRVEDLSTVTRASVDRLLDMGVLHRDDTGEAVYFPRPVRAFLRVFATEYSPAELQGDHRTIARALQGDSADAVVERHYHAVQGRDLEGARESARYYGADLRTLAREISLEGDHEGAARIYEEIVTTYDPKDAYAWEYLGYNLWQPYRRAPMTMPAGLRARIEDALTRACTVDAFNRRNPLFLGRLLGFRGMWGPDIGAAFAEQVGHFSRTLRHATRDEQTDLSWFAKQVRTAFASNQAQDRYRALCAPWEGEPHVHRILTTPLSRRD